jgi:hypothetical protein
MWGTREERARPLFQWRPVFRGDLDRIGAVASDEWLVTSGGAVKDACATDRGADYGGLPSLEACLKETETPTPCAKGAQSVGHPT